MTLIGLGVMSFREVDDRIMVLSRRVRKGRLSVNAGDTILY